MQIQNLSKYAQYVKEKAGLELIEFEHAWATYAIDKINNSLFIADLWIAPEMRRKKMAGIVLNVLVTLAKDSGCDSITSTLMVNSNNVNETLLAQIHYGFKVFGSDSEKIYLKKEI